jgi:exopolyphosphatase/guanosine-5'-triphosphate,3'-diphosphate pyrophosphatase
VRRVAALDCGTNSLRLLIADLDVETGRSVEVDRRTEIVRLGEDVDRTGAFGARALARTFAVLDEYAELIAAAGPERVRLVATSAARDVSNRQAFVDGVKARIGVEPDIVTGEAEALLSYDGATRSLVGTEEVVAPIVVADFGGGSTELVARAGDVGPVRGYSLEIGSVRMTERHLHDDPPTRGQVAAARADISAALDGAQPVLGDVGTLVGVSGTVTTMAAMVLGLSAYDRDRVHHARLSGRDVMVAVEEIVAMTVADRLRLGFMQPGRADVIGGGALVLGAVVEGAGVDELVVSEHDILDGVAWSLV